MLGGVRQSNMTEDPDSHKSSKFGSCTIMSWICTKAVVPTLMVREVTDCGNLPYEGILPDGGTNRLYSTLPHKAILSTLVNHGMCSKNLSGAVQYPASEKRTSLTRWAGHCSGVGNVLSHLSMFLEVKRMVRKMCRLHGGTHDLDMREHARRSFAESELEIRWSRISSITSCGIIGTTIILVFTGVGGLAFEGLEPIREVGNGRLGESSALFCVD